MAKGFYYTKRMDETLRKGIYETQVPTLSFLYQTPSTTKNVEYDIGDKVVLADGREFRYAKSLGNNELFAAHGVQFTYTGVVPITNFAVTVAQGETEITIPAQTHIALTVDVLRGGYVIIFDGDDDTNTCTRGIVGNDASDADVAFKVQLDGRIHDAITTTHKVEVYQNPWAGLEVATSSALPMAGVPTTVVSAAANYFWVQTKGICWVAPADSNVGENGGMLTMWRYNGIIEGAETGLGITSVPSTNSSQISGYCIQGSQAGNGPLLMLVDHG